MLGITPAMIGNPATVQALLESRPVYFPLFNNGIAVAGLEGTVLADFPPLPGRLGANFKERDYIIGPLKEGRVTIGRPVMSKLMHAPAFVIGVPIRDAAGLVIGVIGGVIDLQLPNFLDRITTGSYGTTGGILLVAPEHRLVVTANDKSRVMEALPAPGVNPAVDRLVQGYEGSVTYVNPQGVEVLGAAKRVPAAGWFVSVTLPTRELFAPIHAMLNRIQTGAALFTLLFGGMIWLMLRRELTPMLRTVKTLAALSKSAQPVQPLPITRQDEVGELIGGFNRLLLEVSRREEALQKSEAKHSAMIANISDMISIIGADGVVKYKSPNSERWFGWQPQELVGTDGWLTVHPDDLGRIQEEFRTLLEQAGATRTVEYRYKCKDGSYKPIELTASNMVCDPIIDGVLLNFHDLSERKKGEAVNAALQSQLRESQKMEAIGTLAGGIAHDINNSLATILGNVELARADAADNPAVQVSIEEIHKAAARTRDLVRQILSFSRRQPVERKLTLLAPIVEESVRLLRATLPARLVLDVHCADGVPAVLADTTQIQQVLINLATNALQAIPSGPGRIGVHLDTLRLDATVAEAHPALHALYAAGKDCAVRLAVSDDGVGIEPSLLGRIFEPFYTTKPAGEGTGLGLAVVHGIVQSYDGAIVVTSHPERGSTFTVYLPVAAAPTETTTPPISATNAAEGSGSGDGRHIIYLDDDESLVFLVQRILGRRGFRVSGFTNQCEALAALRAEPGGVDLVVSDYNMPGMSGLDVAREVRSVRDTIPVAIASGFIDEKLHTEAGLAGVQEIIFKADSAEDLCAAIARLALSAGGASPASVR